MEEVKCDTMTDRHVDHLKTFASTVSLRRNIWFIGFSPFHHLLANEEFVGPVEITLEQSNSPKLLGMEVLVSF
jgi:hypothetical protein